MYFIILTTITASINGYLCRLVQVEIMLGNIKFSCLTQNINWYMRMVNGNKKYLDILYKNIPGTLNLADTRILIETILDTRNPDVLAVAEPDANKINFKFQAYKCVKGTISQNRVRICCFVRKNLDYVVEKWNLLMPTVVLQCGNIKMVFTYREWSQGGDMSTGSLHLQEARWTQFLDKVKSCTRNETIIMGDMNFHFWSDLNSPYQRQYDSMREECWEKLLGGGWRQMVVDPTRYQNNQTPACLDQIFCRYPGKVSEVVNLDHGGHDHNLIGIRYRDSKHLLQPEVVKIQKIEGITVEMFAAVMENLNMQEVYEAVHVNDSLEHLVHKVTLALMTLAPVREVKIVHTHHAKWMTDSLREMKQMRDNLKQVAIHGNIYDWHNFKVYRNYVAYQMKLREAEWVTTLIREGERQGKTWKMVKKVCDDDSSSTLSRLETEEGILDTPYQIGEYLNKYFLRKVHRIQETTPANPVAAVEYTRSYVRARARNLQTTNFAQVQPADISKIISNLKNTGSLGVDGISTKVLKQFKEYLCYPITYIVNKSIIDCVYPDKWKCGIVSPIPKKGCLLQPGNWRPVTLLCSMSKILETVLNQQIKRHIDTNHLMPSSQHAYQTGKSTVSAWVEIDTFVTNMMDNGKLVGALLLDMSAAFNLVSKEVIIPKMRILGLGEGALKLVNSYLSGRKNFTKIKSFISSAVDVHTGIGEGSVLGPLAFILTILCLDAVLEIVRQKLAGRTGLRVVVGLGEGDINLFLIVYADDCTPMVAAQDINHVKLAIEIMEEEFTRYFSYTGLKVNQSKCEHIVFSKEQRTPNLVINDRQEASQVTLLGLKVSHLYTFDNHASLVVARMTHKIPYLVKLKKYLAPDNLKRVAEAVCMSVMMYGYEVYGTRLSVQRKVQKGQNQVMRILLDEERTADVGIMLNRLGWVNAKISQKLCSIMLLRRIMVTGCSALCHNLVEQGQQLRNDRYPGRPREWRIAWQPSVRMAKRSFLCNALDSFNDCRLYQRGLDHKRDFKQTAKRSLKRLIPNTNI